MYAFPSPHERLELIFCTKTGAARSSFWSLRSSRCCRTGSCVNGESAHPHAPEQVQGGDKGTQADSVSIGFRWPSFCSRPPSTSANTILRTCNRSGPSYRSDPGFSVYFVTLFGLIVQTAWNVWYSFTCVAIYVTYTVGSPGTSLLVSSGPEHELTHRRGSMHYQLLFEWESCWPDLFRYLRIHLGVASHSQCHSRDFSWRGLWRARCSSAFLLLFHAYHSFFPQMVLLWSP